ncbi:MAG: C45 family autoproteolytic acyltransferase/hydrolase [Planctomycetota bacterium]|jgi:hypothetical protein
MKITTLSKNIKDDGFTAGRLMRKNLVSRIKFTKSIWKSVKGSDRIINERVAELKSIFKTLCPSWLTHTEQMARGAKVSEKDIYMLNCLPSGFFDKPSNNCTSFIKVDRGSNMLFKIRDERNYPQSFFVRNAPVSYQAALDIGNIGVAHFFNQYGLAGACNTGSHTGHVPDSVLFNDCMFMRYIAEKAKSIDDIPALFERIVKKKIPTGTGPERGAIYLFVDGKQGLIMESVSDDCHLTYIKNGTSVVSNHFISPTAKTWDAKVPSKNTTIRRKRMDALLKGVGKELTVNDVFAVSRDRKSLPHALCNDDKKHFWMTISAQLHVVNRKDPGSSINYVCCGNTKTSFYIPVPLSYRKTCQPFMSGEYYNSTDNLYRSYCCSNMLKKEQNTFEKFEYGTEDPEIYFKKAVEKLGEI